MSVYQLQCPCLPECPFTQAVQLEDSCDLIKVLRSGGAHLDFRTRDGITALHRAVLCKNSTALTVSLLQYCYCSTATTVLQYRTHSTSTAVLLLQCRSTATAVLHYCSTATSSAVTSTVQYCYCNTAVPQYRPHSTSGTTVQYCSRSRLVLLLLLQYYSTATTVLQNPFLA